MLTKRLVDPGTFSDFGIVLKGTTLLAVCKNGHEMIYTYSQCECLCKSKVLMTRTYSNGSAMGPHINCWQGKFVVEWMAFWLGLKFAELEVEVEVVADESSD